MRTERESNRSNTPHPAEYAARQDELKRSLETLHTMALSAQAQDVLGEHAAHLVEAVDCARVPGISAGGIIDEVPGWRKERIIPVVGLRPGEVAYTSMTGMTQEQYNVVRIDPDLDEFTKWELFSESLQGSKQCDTKDYEELSLERSSTAGLTFNFPSGSGRRDAEGDIVIDSIINNQPNVVINMDQRRRSRQVVTLSHELTHAKDDIEHPVWLAKRDGELERRTLSHELRAYAIDCRIGQMALTSYRMMDGWQGLLLPNLQLRRSGSKTVEAVRQKVNGPFDSPHAFDPSDGVVDLLHKLKIDSIYKKEKPTPSPQ